MPSRTAPRLNSIQNDSVKPYVDEIRTELGLTTKHISAASYRVKKLDELIPQINRSLAEKHNPSGPVVTSLVNQVMSAIDSVDAITHKLEESSDNINVNLDIIENNLKYKFIASPQKWKVLGSSPSWVNTFQKCGMG